MRVETATSSPPAGVLIVDKPRGLTSHDVVTHVRRIAGVRRVGHAGTLDPDATGVLVVCVGRATKISRFLMEQPKEYVATIHLGVETDSLDADGTIVRRGDPSGVTEEKLCEVLERFQGEVVQIPPMVSALKREGKRLYELARMGLTVERPARRITVFSVRLLEFSPPTFRIALRCSKGTYVRVLASDVGAALGCGAHLSGLRRLAVGRFRAEESSTLEDLAAAAEADRLPELLISLSDALSELPAVLVREDHVRRVANGAAVTPESVAHYPEALRPDDRVRIMGAGGELLGVGKATVPGTEAAKTYAGLVMVRPERMLVGASLPR